MKTGHQPRMTLTTAVFAEWWDEIFTGVGSRENERREIEDSGY